jgi:hypothetical protein
MVKVMDVCGGEVQLLVAKQTPGLTYGLESPVALGSKLRVTRPVTALETGWAAFTCPLVIELPGC